MTAAREPMTRRVVVVPPAFLLSDAWRMMRQGGFRHLPVVEAGCLVGILSDRDILLHSSPLGEGVIEVDGVTVAEVMTPAPYVCEAQTDVVDLVRTMTEMKIDAVPVVDAAEKLIGLVTSTDLLLLLITLDEAKVPIPFSFEIEEQMFETVS
jgi:CBS domain-containing protein